MTSLTAKVVRFHETGDASVLQIDTLPLDEPGEGEVRIKVEAIGLNRAEVMFRNGAYLEAPSLPSRLGYEAAGSIDAIGRGVTAFDIGDRVSTIPAFPMGQYGVYAEYAIVPVHAVVRCPATLSMPQCASLWMQYLTAYGALVDIGRVGAGTRVLVTAASSSVGVAAIHIARHLGAEVIATTRGEDKKAFLLAEGASHVIVTGDEDIVPRMTEITAGQGAELIFDPIGGPLLATLAEVASPGGRIIEYGALDPEPTPYPLFTALANGLIVQGYTLFELTRDSERLARAKAFLLPLFDDGTLRPAIDRTFAFDEIRKAHEYMESNRQQGKIVVTL